MKHTYDDLKIMQSLPLNVKVRMSETRIREWVKYFGEDGVYISFSGGKDSTALLHIVRNLYPDIPAVFVNTGLEYPEIQSFVQKFNNVEILRPKMRFNEVIKKFGYPFIGKEVAMNIYYARKKGEDNRFYRKLFGLGEFEKSPYTSKKYIPLLYSDFIIGSRCCDVMKKSPIHIYERKTKRKSITGQTANESSLRLQKWLKNGCNAFEAKTQVSNPLSFWTEQDILEYIKTEGIEIASVYGDIIFDGCKYKTTKCDRTGCIFCGFGAHFDKGEGRFERLKRTHPKQYEYCMNGGEYDKDGLWKPNKDGLGMAHCIDEINKIYGKDFIKY